MSLRLGILISGRGSNMQALARAAMADDFPASVSIVIANTQEAQGLATAQAMGIDTRVISYDEYKTRGDCEQAMTDCLKVHKVDLVCLAGFMRLLTPTFIQPWMDRLVNIHPSLLPSFKGLNTHERVLQAGVKITGCSVHYVREKMDDGPILGQAAVPVLEGDTPTTLAARVLAAEHQLYPACVRLLANNEGDLAANPDSTLFNPPV